MNLNDLSVSPAAIEIALARADENYEVTYQLEESFGSTHCVAVYGVATPLFTYHLAYFIAAEALIPEDKDLGEVDVIPAPTQDDVLQVLEELSAEQATTYRPGSDLTYWRNLTRS